MSMHCDEAANGAPLACCPCCNHAFNIETVVSVRDVIAMRRPRRGPVLVPVPLGDRSLVNMLKQDKKLNIALFNVRALTNKTFFINDLISENKLDFIFLTETWLQSDGASLLIETSPPNYNFIHSTREGKRGGGLAAIFSDTFKCKYLSFGDFSSFEYQAIILESQTPVLLVPIYRPPKYSASFLPEIANMLCLLPTMTAFS